jgi:LuxR family maltose regulon positive regulatory protein
LSVNTVKTHVRHIYRKLHATRRREAVRRARELHLL